MNAIQTIFISSVAFLIVLCSGCERGYTEYYPVNRSDQKLNVTIVGIQPDLFPTRLKPDTGTSQLKEKVAYISQPVTIADTITIRWTTDVNATEREIKLNRDDFDIPSQVQGGRITLTYTADEQWTIEYSS